VPLQHLVPRVVPSQTARPLEAVLSKPPRPIGLKPTSYGVVQQINSQLHTIGPPSSPPHVDPRPKHQNQIPPIKFSSQFSVKPLNSPKTFSVTSRPSFQWIYVCTPSGKIPPKSQISKFLSNPQQTPHFPALSRGPLIRDCALSYFIRDPFNCNSSSNILFSLRILLVINS
jgi:hypothetical protein